MPHTQAQAIIRRCSVDDAPALSGLARRTFYDTFTGTCTEDDMQQFLDTYYNEERLAAELSSDDDFIFFAELHGEPVGYLRFLGGPVQFPAGDYKKPLELNRLYVDALYKGKGIAQLLMNYYLQHAADNGCDYLWLGVWEHNYRAQSFYRKYGFSFTGHRHPFPIGATPQTDEWWGLEMKK